MLQCWAGLPFFDNYRIDSQWLQVRTNYVEDLISDSLFVLAGMKAFAYCGIFLKQIVP